MTFRCRCWLAAACAAAVVSASPGWAQERAQAEPTALSVAPNQRAADTIAARIRASGQLHHYTIDVTVADGVADLFGTVGSAAQRAEALRIARDVAGVVRVVDRLSINADVIRVQAEGVPGQLPLPLPGGPAAPPALVPPPEPTVPADPPPPAGGTQQQAPAEALPSYQAPLPSPYDLNPPKMPPYAWPTYAPYNNYSRVAQPMAYPYNAFPFIGPCYPFPKVPLGWRAVKLEWDDGYWWYSKLMSKWDWWRLRYY